MFYATMLYCKAILGRGQPELNFGMNHAQGAGLIAQTIDLQSSMLELYMAAPKKNYNNYKICSLRHTTHDEEVMSQ